MIVTASSDGSVILATCQSGYRRDRKAVRTYLYAVRRLKNAKAGTTTDRTIRQPLLFHRMFEMDYDVKTGEYRMTDNFLPEVCLFLSPKSLTKGPAQQLP
jgi:hypothetical protein